MSDTSTTENLSTPDAILAAMPDPPGMMTPKELAEVTGKDYANVRNTLRRLVRRGDLVETEETGGYALPPREPEPNRVRETGRYVISAEDAEAERETGIGADIFMVVDFGGGTFVELPMSIFSMGQRRGPVLKASARIMGAA